MQALMLEYLQVHFVFPLTFSIWLNIRQAIPKESFRKHLVEFLLKDFMAHFMPFCLDKNLVYSIALIDKQVILRWSFCLTLQRLKVEVEVEEERLSAILKQSFVG